MFGRRLTLHTTTREKQEGSKGFFSSSLCCLSTTKSLMYYSSTTFFSCLLRWWEGEKKDTSLERQTMKGKCEQTWDSLEEKYITITLLSTLLRKNVSQNVIPLLFIFHNTFLFRVYSSFSLLSCCIPFQLLYLLLLFMLMLSSFFISSSCTMTRVLGSYSWSRWSWLSGETQSLRTSFSSSFRTLVYSLMM